MADGGWLGPTISTWTSAPSGRTNASSSWTIPLDTCPRIMMLPHAFKNRYWANTRIIAGSLGCGGAHKYEFNIRVSALRLKAGSCHAGSCPLLGPAVNFVHMFTDQ